MVEGSRDVVKVRKLQERRGWAWSTCVAILKPTLLATTKHEWIDGEKIPATGGCVIAMNHVSHIDPLTLAWLLYEHGRLVQYLTKDALFDVPVVGHIVRDARMIPVSRTTTDAAKAFDAAVASVRAGGCVGVYPEGTITKDPTGWPMRGKTGAARIALETGCPVIPIGQWGAQEILAPYTARPHLFPRRTARYKVGDPVDLSDLAARVADNGGAVTNEVLHLATDRIMAAISELVGELRGETPPAERFDPKKAGITEIGNPNKSSADDQKKGRRA
ncbi:1-acyl-sn-glycerol-3-phosphate acyltransferase [Nocardioides marmoriginsengisoli]|uniref:1-acyl-sn-glycerol-3-phosphate acyltransferase n=1 Tax=Nocardioides marmoriginsengisoli TaxID=661483 RepID=A0A3N0CQH8_9ACTN|nr:lysophospholipid acyltransferase family protein [Nocardioides marmoriginsengisoli]RNL65163.1 1-acyl-sn-glycerol-3-phosphate acyltransferase [Nocardioides marmoriginsengisoli]